MKKINKSTMNNMRWYSGVILRRVIAGRGLRTTAPDWLVAAFLEAQEEGLDLRGMTRLLKEISVYDPKANSNPNPIIKSLGFYD